MEGATRRRLDHATIRIQKLAQKLARQQSMILYRHSTVFLAVPDLRQARQIAHPRVARLGRPTKTLSVHQRMAKQESMPLETMSTVFPAVTVPHRQCKLEGTA